MASVLRHILASNRAKHEETGLDLCYVTSSLLATCVFLFLWLIFLFITFFALSASFRLFLLSRLLHPLATLLRRAAARPRVRNRETGLDFGYFTSDIIVTCVVIITYPAGTCTPSALVVVHRTVLSSSKVLSRTKIAMNLLCARANN